MQPTDPKRLRGIDPIRPVEFTTVVAMVSKVSELHYVERKA
jgi:hypothetical protein